MGNVIHINQAVKEFAVNLQKKIGGNVVIHWTPEAVQLADIDVLKNIINEQLQISWDDIKGISRLREITIGRHLFFWFAFYRCQKSKSGISRMLGINHATVCHGIKSVQDLLDAKDEKMSDAFAKVLKYMNEYEQTKNPAEVKAAALAHTC